MVSPAFPADVILDHGTRQPMGRQDDVTTLIRKDGFRWGSFASGDGIRCLPLRTTPARQVLAGTIGMDAHVGGGCANPSLARDIIEGIRAKLRSLAGYIGADCWLDSR